MARRKRAPGPKPGPKPGPGPKPAQRRHRWRRRVVVGGAVLITGTHRSRKLKQQDVEQIEAHAGAPIEDLEEDELDQAISELGIEEQPLDKNDEAALAAAS
jgi:hypothetical protein